MRTKQQQQMDRQWAIARAAKAGRQAQIKERQENLQWAREMFGNAV